MDWLVRWVLHHQLYHNGFSETKYVLLWRLWYLCNESFFCHWHHTAGPPSSAKTLTLCGSGPSVLFNHSNVEDARLTALHRRVMPLPRALINKHTTSLGVPQVVSVNTLNGASLSDGSKERPYGHRSPSLLQSVQDLLHSLPLFDPPFLSESPHLSSILVVPVLLYGLDLIPHSPSPAGTNRSLSTPSEK